MKKFELVYYVSCRGIMVIEEIVDLECESNEEVFNVIGERFEEEGNEFWGMVEGGIESKVFNVGLYEEVGVVVIREDSVLYNNLRRDGEFWKDEKNIGILDGIIGMCIDVGCENLVY